jgi:drug/metabolite transporter (DMT)-like permease
MSGLTYSFSPGSLALAGDAACLLAALIWAFSINLYRKPIMDHGPRAVNLVKCVLSAALFGLTVVALGQFGSLAAAPGYSVVLLVVSGLLGLSIGDSALFAAVRRIGVHPAQLLQTLVPVFTTMIAVTWQGESFGALKAIGTVLIVGGVSLVVAPRRAAPPQIVESYDVTLAGGNGAGVLARGGVALAVLASLCQAFGLVLSKVAMQDVPILTASFLRTVVGAGGLILFGLFDGGVRRAVGAARQPATMKPLIPATFFGAYIGILLMMSGLAWAPASIAALLLATTPVFTMIIGAASGREPFTWRSGAGTALTILGVAVLTLR